MDTHDYFEQDYYAQSLGIKQMTTSDNSIRCELAVTDRHKNGLGGIHGAVIFALADITFAVACNTHQKAIGIQADIRYLRQPKGDRLIATTQAINHGRSIKHYQVSVRDEQENVIAVFTGLAYSLSRPDDSTAA